MPDGLGNRMKEFYENPFKVKLPGRLPIIIRLDGKAFHTYTKDAEKPYDSEIIKAMNLAAAEICQYIQGTKMAYVQSDEISILVYPWINNESQSWFNNDLQKIVSISAAYTSVAFNKHLMRIQLTYGSHEFAIFDSRAFVMPEYEVSNYFCWRQLDWLRNSIQMLAQSLYSPSELRGKKKNELIKMCLVKGHDWNALDNHLKYGSLIKMDGDGYFKDASASIFTENRNVIDKYLKGMFDGKEE